MRAEEVGLRAGPTQEGYGGRGRHDRRTRVGGAGPAECSGPLRIARTRVASGPLAGCAEDGRVGDAPTQLLRKTSAGMAGWLGASGVWFPSAGSGQAHQESERRTMRRWAGGGGRGWFDDLEVAPAIPGPRLHAAGAARPCSRWRGRERREGRVPGCAQPGPPGLVPDGGDVSGGRGGSQAARSLGH